MRLVLQRSGRSVPKAPSHPEVNQERPTAREPNNQILAATLQRLDALALELGGDFDRLVGPYEPGVVDPHALERAPDELGLEPDADGLDLGQLGHLASLAVATLRPVSGKRPLSSRGAQKLGERERGLGLDPEDEAARWLEANDPKPPPVPPKAAFKSKELHRWRQRQQRDG